MRRLIPLLALAAAWALPAAAGAQPYVATTPSAKVLYHDGPTGRFLMDGPWLFELNPAQSGPQLDVGTSGWKQVTVPNAWNVGDPSEQAFMGGVGWYRKDFRLPSSAARLAWLVRFESVNYRSKVWLNGHPIGRHTGAYLAFELRLPPHYLKRSGVNRLVIRVDSRRFPTDFPPSGFSEVGQPTGGWWNYGGLLREVYLREVDGVDASDTLVRPYLPCARCAASILYRVRLRGTGPGVQRVNVTARFGNRRIDLGSAAVAAGAVATLSKTIRVAHPRLWAPDHPYLYTADVTVTRGGRTVAAYLLRSGVRSIKVAGGHLYLNGHPLHFRGVGVHEDSLQFGSALDNQLREQTLQWVKELGATVVRSHYPLHPYTLERMDQLGIMDWSEIPVYAIKTQYLKQMRVRELAAQQLAENIQTNENHPSIIIWSVGNELSANPGPVQADYLKRAADTAHTLDPTRPVGYAVAGYPAAGCQPEYAPLDVLGFNEYFGWYPGPNGQLADRTELPDYLDQIHRCYHDKAIVITETGAEANRHGPVEERGTYEYQSDYAQYHFGIYATKPWLSGAIWWTLQEFWVRPGWDGGNPHPTPPVHTKGLIAMDGTKKPAWAVVQQIFKSTDQLGGA
jgi:Glycosyl hydrolases family 2, TIM barrel domain/Glycosyl hydrolases family 2, sugar binding domain/Glycosyl hydrolases family 2